MRKRARAEAWARSQSVVGALRRPTVKAAISDRDQPMKRENSIVRTLLHHHIATRLALHDGVKVPLVGSHGDRQTNECHVIFENHRIGINARHRGAQFWETHLGQRHRLSQAGRAKSHFLQLANNEILPLPTLADVIEAERLSNRFFNRNNDVMVTTYIRPTTQTQIREQSLHRIRDARRSLEIQPSAQNRPALVKMRHNSAPFDTILIEFLRTLLNRQAKHYFQYYHNKNKKASLATCPLV